MKRSLLLLLLISSFYSYSQLNESFNDGDFTANPVWAGSTSDWQIVTSSDAAAGAASSNTLRLNVPSGAGTKYLSTQIVGSWGSSQTWAFWMGRRAQAATDANHVLIWLWSSEADLSNTTTINGYRLRFGDDTGGDELTLERVVNGVPTQILASSGSVTNAITDYGFLVRVVRSNTGQWQIFTSTLPTATGTGAIATDVPSAANTPNLQGTVTDNTFSTFNNGYVGFAAVHTSGANPRSAAEFDQFQFSFVAATAPVTLKSFTASKDNSKVKLFWQVGIEDNVSRYEILRSADGVRFENIGSVQASAKASYWFGDDLPLAGVNFYRLRTVDNDGKFKFSHIVNVNGRMGLFIHKFPNPAIKNITVQHPQASASAVLHITSMSGQTVKLIRLPQAAVQTDIDVSNLLAGNYIIEFRDGKNKVSTKFLKQ